MFLDCGGKCRPACHCGIRAIFAAHLQANTCTYSHGETPQPTIVGFAETRCRVCPLRRLSDVEYKQSVIISKMVVEHPKPKSPSGRDPGILCRNLGHSGNSEGDWTSSCQPLFISSPFFSVTTHEGEPMRTTLALVSASVLHAH